MFTGNAWDIFKHRINPTGKKQVIIKSNPFKSDLSPLQSLLLENLTPIPPFPLPRVLALTPHLWRRTVRGRLGWTGLFFERGGGWEGGWG